MEKISTRLLNWTSILGDSIRAQAETTATMPFIYPQRRADAGCSPRATRTLIR